jgi:BlaI family penicillinase repressor
VAVSLLKPNELEIMKTLWQAGPLKPAEIQQLLPSPVKNSALRGQLASLVGRGQVKRRRRGKAFYYSAATPKDGALKALARRMADVFCGGSTVALIGQLIESTEHWSEEDLHELRRIAEGKVALVKADHNKVPQRTGTEK